MNSVLKLSFCAYCGLYSRSPFNSNKNPDYICKCSGFVKEATLQIERPVENKAKFTKRTIQIEKNKFICESCGLFINAKNDIYLCKCKNFSIPKIEVEQNKIQNKKSKSKKSKPKTKKKKTKSKTKV